MSNLSYNKARSALRQYQSASEGNWRYKGLLLAGFTGDYEAIGEAWPTNDRYLSRELGSNPATAMGEMVSLGSLPEDTMERTLAREAFGKDAIEAGEVMDKDRYMKRMLLTTSGEELDVLWREQLLDTVIMGAEPRKFARDAATVIPVNKRIGDIPRGSAQKYAPEVAEGATIGYDPENYDTVDYTCTKNATGFALTDVMIDSAEPAIVERQVRYAGAAVENGINRKFLNELIDNAGNEHDTAGSNQDVKMVNKAAELVEVDDFGPVDTLVLHPEAKTALFDDSNLAYANRAGENSVIKNRTFNELLGMMLYTGSDGVYNSSNTWGFAADGELGAVAYDKSQIGLVMYKDLETKDFEDPIRDLVGGNVRAYTDVVYMQPNAACRIEY